MKRSPVGWGGSDAAARLTAAVEADINGVTVQAEYDAILAGKIGPLARGREVTE